MLHINDNGSERSIAFAPRALTNPERNYSQFDKEGFQCYMWS